MTFYPRLRATAERLIRLRGKSVTIVRPGTVTGPAHNPTVGPPVEIPAKFVETGYSMTDRNATLILTGDKLGLVEPTVAVALEDTIEIDGETYQLVDVQPLDPGGLRMLTEIVARR